MGAFVEAIPNYRPEEVREDEDGNRCIQFDDMVFIVELRNPVSRDLDITALPHGNTWPGSAIPVSFGSLSSAHKAVVKQALGLWSAAAGVKFVEGATDAKDFVLFENAAENSSVTGYNWRLGAHRVKLALDGAAPLPTIAHEIGHVLGLGHEHQRHDAANYIELLTDNLTKEGKRNMAPGSLNVGSSYDLLSIMHYAEIIYDPALAIDKNAPVFKLREPYRHLSGKVGIHRISALDAAAVRAKYPAHQAVG